MAEQSSTQTAVQQALIEQVTQYIAQYTPNPRIISYKPNASGDVMGKFESQSRVFTFRLSDKGLVYKPLVQRKDNESDDDYALRFDTGSELWLEHFDAAKAYKPKPSVRVPTERGDRKNPKCSAISYHCGVCISLGKNCIKNANTAALKERLQKINSLSRMAAKGEAVPQVKTGVIGARVDPASLKRKASDFAKKQAGGVKSTNPKEKVEPQKNKVEPQKLSSNIFDNKGRIIFEKPDENGWLDERVAAHREAAWNAAKRTKDPAVKFLSESQLQKTHGASLKDPRDVSVLIKDSDFQRFSISKTADPKNFLIVDRQVIRDETDRENKQSTRDRQSAARAAAEPNKTTTLSTPLPLTAQSQKRLERGESISDNETYHVKKEGNKFRVTDPNKFEDKGKLVDKAGLAAHMKELESKPSAVKKSSSMNPAIPINNNPDTMLRALRDGRLIGDAKQGYEIQQRGKDEYLVTTMPNKNGDYSGVMSRKELVDFVKGGGDASKFNKEQPKSPTSPSTERKEAKATSPHAIYRLEKFQELVNDPEYGKERAIKGLKGWKNENSYRLTDADNEAIQRQIDLSTTKVKANDLTQQKPSSKTQASPKAKTVVNEKTNEEKATPKYVVGRIVVSPQRNPLKRFGEDFKDEGSPTLGSKVREVSFPNTPENLDKFAKAGGTISKKQNENILSLRELTEKKLPPIPLTSGKNLTPSQKKQSRTADQVAIDRTKSDVSNATKRINTLDDSIKKLKAGKGVMSEGDLKKVASLERQKGEWEKTREGYRAKLEKLAKPVEAKPEPRLAQTDLFGNPVAIAEPTPTVTVKAKPKASSKVDVFTPEMKSHAEKVLKGAEKGLPSIKDFGFDENDVKEFNLVQDYASLKKKGRLGWDEKKSLENYIASNYDYPKGRKSSFVGAKISSMLENWEKMNETISKESPVKLDLTSMGGGDYTITPIKEVVSQFRKKIVDAKPVRTSLDKPTSQGLGKSTSKEYDEALAKGTIDQATYELLTGKPRKDSADLYHVNIPNSILVSRQDADDCILTYVTDNSGNLMGVCQINGVKYRFLKPVFGATVLTPLSETGLGYLFGMAPDLSLPQTTSGLTSLVMS